MRTAVSQKPGGRILLVACFLALAVGVQAASITVPSRGISTIGQAMIKAKAGDTVWVENGTYKEHVFVKTGVALMARSFLAATIDGSGRGTVVTLGKNCSVNGFIVKNGTIGVFSSGAGNTIEKCRIMNNWQTGIICVRHLPKVEDNFVVFNRASGIQGWDVRATTGSINHNTIAYNANHGIAVGGKSSIIVENNVIAYNERFGLKLSDEAESSKVVKNNLYRNLRSTARIPEGNYSFDPAFMAPRSKFDFRPDPKLCCQVKGSDNENLGSRLDF